MDDHLGYGKHDPAGRNGGNSRNWMRSETLVTEAGPVEIEVLRDRESSFEPVIAGKRQRRLSGVDDLVISLSTKGMTQGEISAHLAEIYGAQVSKRTISTVTDRAVEGMVAWQNRPLDPVIFIACVNVKIWDGNVANRAIYVALAVTVEGTRDILRVTGRGGREVLDAGFVGDQELGYPGLLDRRVRWTQWFIRGDRCRVAPSHCENVYCPLCRSPNYADIESIGAGGWGCAAAFCRHNRSGVTRGILGRIVIAGNAAVGTDHRNVET